MIYQQKQKTIYYLEENSEKSIYQDFKIFLSKLLKRKFAILMECFLGIFKNMKVNQKKSKLFRKVTISTIFWIK